MADIPPKASSGIMNFLQGMSKSPIVKTGAKGLGVLGTLWTLWNAGSAVSDYSEMSEEAEDLGSVRPVSAYQMLVERQRQETLAQREMTLQQSRPDLYENLQWLMAMGEPKPVLGPGVIRIGPQPDYSKIDPQAMREAIGMMTGG